eukprot:symbB.v1.2.012040.t1/scaffold823.1/size159554/3
MGRSPALDWDTLRSKGVHPSFSLPSSYNGLRSQVDPGRLAAVCARHPQEEFRQLCDREAVLVPLMLNHPEQRQLDHQVFRSHLHSTRSPNGTPKVRGMCSELAAEALRWRSDVPTQKHNDLPLDSVGPSVPNDSVGPTAMTQTTATEAAWKSLMKTLAPPPPATPPTPGRPGRRVPKKKPGRKGR